MKRISIAMAAFLAACSMGMDPEMELIGDRYALVSVVGDPLPKRLRNETWIADTIAFNGDEWARVEVVILHGEGTSPNQVRRTSEGFIRRSNGEIVLDFECNDVIIRSCIAPARLTPGSGGVLERVDVVYGQVGDQARIFRYEPVR